jgi:hypothetical protein
MSVGGDKSLKIRNPLKTFNFNFAKKNTNIFEELALTNSKNGLREKKNKKNILHKQTQKHIVKIQQKST